MNAGQKRLLLERVIKRFGDDLAGHTFAVWGLAFKPNTDDMHEARRIFGARIDVRESNYDCLDGASALLIHTEWLPYRRPDFDAMRQRLANPILFDGRNLYAPAQMARRGFEYHSIGRLPVGTTAVGDPS